MVRFAARSRFLALMSGVATLALSASGHAADAVAVKKPAVSAINARIEGAFGSNDGKGFGHAAGAITMPIGERFGFQVDGLVRFSNSDNTDIGGAAHLFWRDPGKGLVGLYASHMRFNGPDVNVSRVGVEAEAYLGDFSLLAVGGWQQAKAGSTKKSGAFADIDFAYYPTDDLRLTAGYRYDGFDSFGVVGAEYKFASSASAKIEGQFGEDTTKIWAGLNFHIGGNDSNKSLKGRQREDDPTIWITRQYAPVLTTGAGGGGGGGGSCFNSTTGGEFSNTILVCPSGVTPPQGAECSDPLDEFEAFCYSDYSPKINAGDRLCFAT